MTGRTTWWAKDAAWHRRERIVELGEEFGPAGPSVMDVLSAWAQEQRNGGKVRGGLRSLAREAFVTPSDARSVITSAAEIGALDELDFDSDDRRFRCRVSGWEADAERGRAAIRMAKKRALAGTLESMEEEGNGMPTATSDAELRPVTPSALPDQTIETTNPPNPPQAGGRKRDQQKAEDWAKDTTARLFPDHPDAVLAVRRAPGNGATTDEEIVAFVQRTGAYLLSEASA